MTTKSAYIYQASLLCEPCAWRVSAQLNSTTLQNTPDTSWEYQDSDHFPQGPYPNGGGESDNPQHCDICGTFLENPLTGDGEQHVIEAIQDDKGNQAVLETWQEFYNYLFED